MTTPGYARDVAAAISRRRVLAWPMAAGLAASGAFSDHLQAAQPSIGAGLTTALAPQFRRVEGAMRGVWIPTADHTSFWNSPAEMSRQGDELASAGFNTLFVVVWNQGRTLYPSRVMKTLTGVPIEERLAGRDPLQEVLDMARPRGLKVYAWFEFGFASDMNGGKGREIIERRPHWASLTREGQHVVKNGFRWLNALDPEVQDFAQSLVLEVVRHYDVTGIQGDDRLPAMASHGGYNPGVLAAYRAEHEGRSPPNDTMDPAWLQWRANQLNGFLERLYRSVKAARPACQVSMSPSVFPWALQEYLQDWPTWLRNGWVDTVSPQLYRRDIEAYTQVVQAVAREQVSPDQRFAVFPGVLLNLGRSYQASDAFITAMVDANRREGLAGEVYFYNEGVRPRLDFFRSLYA